MRWEIQYKVRFQPWDRSWLLSGPVGANGFLLFQSARGAVSHARWAAKANGGTIKVYDPQGKLFKVIEIEPDLGSDDHFVLPNSDWPT
jgi:hypothetical protein